MKHVLKMSYMLHTCASFMIRWLICRERQRNLDPGVFISKLCQLVWLNETDYNIHPNMIYPSPACAIRVKCSHHRVAKTIRKSNFSHGVVFVFVSVFFDVSFPVNRGSFCLKQNGKLEQTEGTNKNGPRERGGRRDEGKERRSWTEWMQTLCLLFPQAIRGSTSINLHDDKRKTSGYSSFLRPVVYELLR